MFQWVFRRPWVYNRRFKRRRVFPSVASGINADAGIGLLHLVAVAQTVSKSASAGIGLVKCTAVAAASSKAADAGLGLVELVGVSPASSKVAAAGIGSVEFVGAAIDTEAEVTSDLVASASFVWRIGLGCTIEKVT